MANLITFALEAPPATVKVQADFYDDDEKRALLASPIGSIFTDLPGTLELPTTDICAYYLYYKRRLRVDNYSSHADILRQWHQALVEFDGQFKLVESSMQLTSASNTNAGTMERLGEGIGLAVASKLHGLHQADWSRIPSTNTRKTFDFQRPWTASDGRQFVQLEAKGSAAKDNHDKTASVSNHKASIKAKKTQVPDADRRTASFYGTIAVLDDRRGSVARCWLVDPPPEELDDPYRFRILTRLFYIADLVLLLGSRSNLSASLQTRLASLSALADISPLDDVPLKKANGEEFPLTAFSNADDLNPWFLGKSVASDGSAGGIISVLDPRVLMLIAMREPLIGHVAQQDFSIIENYSFTAQTLVTSVNCVVPTGRFKREFSEVMQIPANESYETGGYVYFRLEGHLHYTQSGLVVGILPIPENWRRRK